MDYENDIIEVEEPQNNEPIEEPQKKKRAYRAPSAKQLAALEKGRRDRDANRKKKEKAKAKQLYEYAYDEDYPEEEKPRVVRRIQPLATPPSRRGQGRSDDYYD